MRSLTLVGLLFVLGCARQLPPPAPPDGPRLLARAVLPWDTFADGPPSGAHLPGHPSGAPWPTQPVQGFSALVALEDGGFLALADNGYGNKENSSDFLLRVYAVSADWDAGRLGATVAFTLSDPRHRLPFPIVHDFTAARLLTGADLDPESLVRAPDGTFWVGDEFGPFLLHVDAQGALLEPPYELPDGDGGVLASPDSPFLPANLAQRALEALRADAQAHDAGPVSFSPDEALLRGPAQVKALHAAGFTVVPWTVNDPARMRELVALGVDGLITDRPDVALAQGFDGGLDVQGHRGARGLAPENTLPAFARALALGVTTLELDVTATAGGAVVWHDAVAGPPKCRGGDGGVLLPLADAAQVAGLVCDGLLPAFPEQTRTPSPLDATLPFTLAALADVLALPGPESRVRFNIETKLSGTGAPHDTPEWLTRHVAATLAATGFTARATLQSFDWRSLRVAHAEFPALATVMLLGANTAHLPPEARADLPWPERPSLKPRVRGSGGLENLALSTDGTRLVALLEKPLSDAPARELLAFDFDLATRRFVGLAFRVPLHERATAVADLAFVDASHGYALERDDSEGLPDGYKHLIRLTLPSTRGGLASREDAADLLALPSASGPFSFPFITIEGLAVLPGGRLAIVNDNNLPFGRARHPGGTEPDGTELLMVTPGR